MSLFIVPSRNGIASGQTSAIDVNVFLFELWVYTAVEYLHPARYMNMKRLRDMHNEVRAEAG